MAFTFMLETLKRNMETLYPDLDLIPSYIMSDFAPAIIKSVKETFPSIIHLKCNYHFKNLKELTKINHFKAKNLKPTEIPGAYKPYFLTRAFLDKRKRNHYSPHRIFKYDLSILNKLPSKALFDCFLEIVMPFWREYCPDALKFSRTNLLREKISQAGNIIFQNPYQKLTII